MASAVKNAPDSTSHPSSRRANDFERDEREVKKEASALGRFWTKLNNDWVFNFSGTLAYGLLTSIFSILLVIIAIGGLLLGSISLTSRTNLENGIAGALPGGASGAGGEIVRAATHTLNNGAPLILIIGVIAALIGGSGLFVTMENAFGVVFRLRGRNPIRQRIMAIGMLLIFVVLVPIILLASTVPSIVLRALGIGSSNPINAFFVQVVGLVVAFVAASILFAAIYIVVPNKPVRFGEAWKGTLVAAGLLVLYELLFPIYESFFIKPGSLGALAGFAIVIIIFFYYLAFILLAGAEVNSWAAGQRETAAPIDAILHELQAHNTTRGAAGPTAGQPHEDLQTGKGARAMDDTPDAIKHERKDHRDDAQPPKYAESGVTGSGYRITKDAATNEAAGIALGTLSSAQPSTADTAASRVSMRLLPPLTTRQRRTVAVFAVSGTVILAGVARVVVALVKDDEPTPATR